MLTFVPYAVLLIIYSNASSLQNISDDILQNDIQTYLSSSALHHLAHSNHALKDLFLSELCTRATQRIYRIAYETKKFRLYRRGDAYYDLIKQRKLPIEDFDLYIHLFTIDRSIEFDGDFIQRTIYNFMPFVKYTGNSPYLLDNVIIINKSRMFLINNCEIELTKSDVHALKYHDFVKQHDSILKQLSQIWKENERKFLILMINSYGQLIQYSLTWKVIKTWRTMMIVIKKDILKIMINARKNNTMDIEFYYNEQWLVFTDCIFRSSLNFQFQMYHKIYEFIQVASKLINSAKLYFNYSHQSDFSIFGIGRKIQSKIHDNGAINALLRVYRFDAEIGLPYGDVVEIDDFFDVHNKIRALQKRIRTKIEAMNDVNASVELALNFEILKNMKMDTMYRDSLLRQETENTDKCQSANCWGLTCLGVVVLMIALVVVLLLVFH